MPTTSRFTSERSRSRRRAAPAIERERPQEEAFTRLKTTIVAAMPSDSIATHERGGELLPAEPSTAVPEIRADHQGLPFVGLVGIRDDGEIDGWQRRRRCRPSRGARRDHCEMASRSASTSVSRKSASISSRCRATSAGGQKRRSSDRRAGAVEVDAAHDVSPARGFTRARTNRTRPAIRSVSAASTARPARVRR